MPLVADVEKSERLTRHIEERRDIVNVQIDQRQGLYPAVPIGRFHGSEWSSLH